MTELERVLSTLTLKAIVNDSAQYTVRTEDGILRAFWVGLEADDTEDSLRAAAVEAATVLYQQGKFVSIEQRTRLGG